MIDPLLTVRDVATLTRLSRRGVRHLVATHRIPHLRLGGPRGRIRFEREAVLSWLRESRVMPGRNP